jgi:DNA-binding CsgD family transcriptional regulator
MPHTTHTIDAKLKCLFDQMPGAWGCKDENSVFMYANAEYGRIIGLPQPEDCIGRTDFEMPCDTVNCAGLFRVQDKKVMQTAQRMQILDIHPFAGYHWKIYVFTKTPLKNEDDKIIGTIFHGVDITDASTIEIVSLLASMSTDMAKSDLLGQNSYIVGNKFHDIKLSERQSQVLFFLLRGKLVKQTARILDLACRTVDDHLEQLRVKFHVQNKYELIDEAIKNGFLNIIPESLFNKQLSIELKKYA